MRYPDSCSVTAFTAVGEVRAGGAFEVHHMESSDQACVLIVEDEDSIRLTLRDYLKSKGYPVVVASDGVGAIKQLLDNPVEVIVSDYRMDILGGDYWIRFLKEYCLDKKVIITSGFLKPEFPIPFPVLYKPFDYSELERLVAAALAEGQSAE